MSKVIQFFVANFWFKVLSLLLAIVAWGIIQGELVYEESRELRVNIIVPEGMSIRGDLVRSKSVVLRGPKVWMIDTPDQLQADVILPAAKKGRIRIRLDKNRVKGLNDRIQLIIHDPYLEIFMDKSIERTVRVKER